MDIIFDFISVRTFWRLTLFFHFVLAVGLLSLVTLQAMAVLMPVRQPAGRTMGFFVTIPTTSIATAIVLLYVPQFLMGCLNYIKYRTYVRIPMEQLGHWWTVGSFEFKEHVVTMGMGLLPAFWYFWRQPLSAEHASIRKWVTVFIAFTVWYAFIVGHVANDFRGVAS
jgi:hypothetical protein